MPRNDASPKKQSNPQPSQGLNIYVITHVFQGILQDVRAFVNEKEADKYEEKLCKDNKVPYDPQERHMFETDDDIGKWTVTLS